ncbi:MAG: helix-turn-helix transcriptional regulator [Anaerolineales bacterium]|nr:helix-turn-helix transcriptional regulator [Anaerolineales bacterium]
MTPTFGHWLRQRRKALGLTQKALAQQAGCAEVTLRKIESGDLQPSAPLVTSLAQALRAWTMPTCRADRHGARP